MMTPIEQALEALKKISSRLQMDIDDGSRPDQWSMQDLVEKARTAIAALEAPQALDERASTLFEQIEYAVLNKMHTGDSGQLVAAKAALSALLAAQPQPGPDRWADGPVMPPNIEGRMTVWLTNGKALHPLTQSLVVRFARALAAKLADAETKYGYSDGWISPDWMDECRAKLAEHVAKGDPRDVAAYCAFLWYHGASTTRPEVKPVGARPLQKIVDQLESVLCDPEGRCAILGSPGDLAEVDKALDSLRTLAAAQPLQAQPTDAPAARQVRMLTPNELAIVGVKSVADKVLCEAAILMFIVVNAGCTIPASGKLEE